MARIQSLLPTVIAQIAAGEVIERPAAVIKELLENSIDAGANRIDVEITAGGTESIVVVDNGRGIHPEDLTLAFHPHATSKLRAIEDLDQIGTLGFRGEALASIGSVAQVLLQSRAIGEDRGAEIRCDGGQLSETRAWNGAVGTRIEVKHLFYNVPVRRKFMKAVATVLGHVCEAVTRIGLAYPNLHLRLQHQGRLVYEIPQTATLPDRIGLFFGREVQDALYEVVAPPGPIRLWGYVTDPRCDRGNPKLQYLFVNGRWIRDRSLSHAIQEAYRNLLMVGRYAVAFLYLELPTDQVDVNVHPTKSEVRFRDQSLIYALMRSTIKARLLQEHLIPELGVPPQEMPAKKVSWSAAELTAPRELPEPEWLWPTPSSSQTRMSPSWLPPGSPGPTGPAGPSEPPGSPWIPAASPPARPALPFEHPTPTSPRRHAAESQPAPWERPHPPTDFDPTRESSPMPRVPVLAPSPTGPAVTAASTVPAFPPMPWPTPPALASGAVLQVHDAYLVLETPEGIQVIDQHALHERILFEQFRRRIQSGQLEIQRLLIPEPVELLPAQAAAVLEHQDALRDLGMEISDFGGNTILLSSYPTLMQRRTPRELFLGLVDALMNQDRPPTREAWMDHLLATMACKAAVKAGDRLSPEEIQYLLHLRGLAEESHHCPHGRPTALTFSRHELDRQFRR